MKALKRLLSVTLSAILLLSALPVALAEDTAATTVTRIEAENYVAALSTTTAASITTSASTDAEQASGGKYLNNCRLNDVICLGEVDLTGLTSVTVSIATNTITSGFAFTIDGQDTVIATVANGASGGWTTFGEYTATVSADVSAADLVGTHILYMTVNSSSNNMHGGNMDYVELTKTTPVVEETTVEVSSHDLNAALSSGNYVKETANTNIGSTKDNTVLAYSNITLDELSAITFNHAPFNNANITVGVYYGDTYDTATLLMTCDLTETLIGTGNWYDADNYRDESFEIPEDVNLTGTTNLFFDLNTTNNYGGNYKTFILHYGSSTVIKSEKSLNFADDIDTGLSTTPYTVNTTNHLVESTGTGTVLAYPNIQVNGLTGVSFNCSPNSDLKMEIYAGKTMADATLVATPTLNNAQLDGATAWYAVDNARESDVISLSLNEITTDTTALFFKLTAGRGNFYDFTLYYAEPIDGALSDICQLEAEEYIWGATGTEPNWIRANPATQLESPNNGDIFYLGKAALSDLTYISMYLANNGPASEVTFYADPTVDFDALTAHTTVGTNNDSAPLDHDRYQYTTDPLSGGIEIANIAIGNTGSWTTYSSFYAVIDDTTKAALGDGKHEIYMKVTNANRAGNIDYIRFNGLSKADVDTSSNWPSNDVTITFIGKYNETIATETATSVNELAALLESIKAPTIHGFTFMGWDDDRSAAELFETYKNDSFSITAVYEVDATATYTPTMGADFTAVDGNGNDVTADSALTFDARVTVTASLEKEVAYWVLDGAKVGFGDSSYTFYVSGNNTIDVVYADEVEEGETLTSSVVLQQSVAPYNDSTYTFSVVAQTSIVGDDSVSEYGVIYAGSLDALNAVRSGKTANVITVKSSKTAANAQYITHLLQVKAGKTRYAMAYAVIDGVRVYSAQYATVTTPTDGSTATPTMAAFQ